jgi:hypothetical protein
VLGDGVNEMGLTRSGYLKAMGIDVWASRSAIAPEVVVAVESAIQSMNSLTEMSTQALDRDVETTAPVQTEEALAGTPLPEFILALFHYETVGICLSLGAESELPRRFCDDVARTMGGNIESLRFQLLKWPMLSTSGIDQSINAAREVVTQKFRQMPSKVLVFGDDVGDYYNPLRDLAPMSVGAVGAQAFLKVPSLKKLLESGSSKRELMLAMLYWLRSEAL